MKWDDWLELETIKVLVRHASGVAVSMLLYWLIGRLLHLLVDEGLIRLIIEDSERFLLLVQFVWFVYQSGLVLWKKRLRHDGTLGFLVA